MFRKSWWNGLKSPLEDATCVHLLVFQEQFPAFILEDRDALKEEGIVTSSIAGTDISRGKRAAVLVKSRELSG
ncbi:conserved hypothetical protein [Ricinus communis]|uniref:Uncharacterized protein n=1 Tax=Ricinus communis TaxID=3988 RepID=B9RZT7_RICCO|nr:conserved hypothetical protein [Ricinus communis]